MKSEGGGQRDMQFPLCDVFWSYLTEADSLPHSDNKSKA